MCVPCLCTGTSDAQVTQCLENVPEDLVNKLIGDLSSAGDMSDIDKELERFYQFKEAGITDLSIRLFDDPWDGLKTIGEKVLPALKQ